MPSGPTWARNTQRRKERTMYTLQEDRHGNRIICRGDDVRNGYRIIAHGSYGAMVAEKAHQDLGRPSVAMMKGGAA